MRVLFIGNSYTYFNNLPKLLEAAASADGVNINAEASVSGGYTLSQHTDPDDPVGAVTLKKLQEPWDYVIVQEHSRRPVIPDERDGLMRPAVRRIKELAQASGSKVLLYMTWGKRYGDRKTGYATYDDMQEALAQIYMSIGSEFDIKVAPVGLAFRKALEIDKDIALWDPDNSHPSLLGSLLAAYVIYGSLSGKDPIGCSHIGDAESSDADLLKQAAHRALY